MISRLHPRGEAGDLLVHDRVGALERLRGAARETFDDRTEVVQVVEENLVEVPGRRFDVTRQRDVDDEQRPPAPRAHHLFDRRPRENGLGGSRGGDDDVGGGERVGEIVPGNRPAVEMAASRRAAAGVLPAIGDLVHTLRAQVDAGQLRHLPRAENQDVQPFEIPEDLLRERDRGVADGDRAFGEARFRTHALADGERWRKQAVGQRAGRLQLVRGGICGLDLPQNLRLANDQRVEAGRHLNRCSAASGPRRTHGARRCAPAARRDIR